MISNRPWLPSLILAVVSLSTSAYAADYFVQPDGDDAQDGSLNSPFRTIAHALDIADTGDTVNIRAGTYRLMDEQPGASHIMATGATETSFLTIQAYEGEDVTILGSLSTEEQSWEAYDGGLYRMPADFLPHDPTGMFAGDVRIAHVMKTVSGTRSHADVVDLSAPGQWTKADASGVGCPSENSGCYIYLMPIGGEDPNTQTFELSQRKLFYTTGDVSYMTVRGLRVLYTQNSAFSFEGGRGQVIEDNVLGHNSNGNDNAYSVFVSYGGGVVIRNNEIFDSEYWGGTPNSRGITLMDMDPSDPALIEGNYVHDIIGMGVTTKGGVSNVIVRGNLIRNVGKGVETPGPRCHWTKPDCVAGDPEYYPAGAWQISENAFVGCGHGVHMLPHTEADPDPAWGDTIYNNVFFANVTAGINISLANAGTVIANNIFASNPRAVYLNHGNSGTEAVVEDFLPMFAAHHNLFFDNDADYFLRPDWTGADGSGTGFSLDDTTSSHDVEDGSLSGDPQFVDAAGDDFHLQTGSPAEGAGDGSFYSVSAVDMGMYPLGDGGAAGSGASGAAGSAGTAGGTSGGTGGGSSADAGSEGGTAGTGGNTDPGSSAISDDDDGGCSCSAASRTPGKVPLALGLLIAGILIRRRWLSN